MPDDHEVGYRKPPLHTRFKKGQSGNPSGRPKDAKNLKTDLEEEMQEKIIVREGATRKEVSKQRAMIKALAAEAVQGDTRAATLLANLILKLLDTGAPTVTDNDELNADDLAILETYERRIHNSPTRPTPDGPPSAQQADEDGTEDEGS